MIGLFRVRLWVSSECRLVDPWRAWVVGQSTEAVKVGLSYAAREGDPRGWGEGNRP